MTEKLTMEQRAQREADARFAEETMSEVRQFAALRAKFPDLTDKELAHRMVITVPHLRRLKKLLEK